MSAARSGWRRLALGAAAIVAVILIARALVGDALDDPAALAERLRGVPGLAPLFVGAYATAASLALPATPFTLAGGAIFGTMLGTVLNWAGATLGATGAYFLARGVAGNAFRDTLGAKAGRLDALSASATVTTIARLRLIPVLPFNGLSLGAGLAGVRPRPYILGTAIGILPGTAIYTWFATSLLDGATGASRTAFVNLAISSALLLALSFLPALVARVRRGGAATPTTGAGGS